MHIAYLRHEHKKHRFSGEKESAPVFPGRFRAAPVDDGDQ
jgi:hypothetical protein